MTIIYKLKSLQGRGLISKRFLSTFNPEFAFEMSQSSIRFGRGVTKEVGADLAAMNLKDPVCIVTDPKMLHLPPMQKVVDSLTAAKVKFEIFSDTYVEPTDASLKQAIEFCRSKKFAAFVAVGGGSVMDTAKACNLYSCYPSADFEDFVNAPIGKGKPVPGKLLPLIAIPTTAGTGSETTGVSIFDHLATGAKTGIRDRALRPLIGIIDPDHTLTCSPTLTAYSGLDVLSHALESFTAVPYRSRITGAPSSPLHRPAYQGSNPISDIWSAFALRECSIHLTRSVEDNDPYSRERMALAATAAGIGFGNAGVTLPHAMSYPIASNVKNYFPKTGYDGATKPALVPHGLSVILTAPSVFEWTCQADPDKHLLAAAHLGANVNNVKPADAGRLLADTIRNLLSRWNFVPDGLKAIGYTSSDVDTLIKGTLPQRKVLDVAPRQPTPDDLGQLFSKSMTLFT